MKTAAPLIKSASARVRDCPFQARILEFVRLRQGNRGARDKRQDISRGVRSKRQPIETRDLPESMGHIYSETIIASNAGALTLAGGGLRAIVEAICIDRKVSGQDLQKKIDDLVAKGLLAKPQADLLHEERYIGNAALHEILPPAKQEIEDGLVIVEGLMNTIYILPLRAERLHEKRQKRTKT